MATREGTISENERLKSQEPFLPWEVNFAIKKRFWDIKMRDLEEERIGVGMLKETESEKGTGFLLERLRGERKTEFLSK